ncbi:MAG: hypothetical protein EP343_06595 [Deltaproteobacteria bacterium]|nr:MAG: hypothetical protein EP343_06595 [Deltaproteobacteria bacterium]
MFSEDTVDVRRRWSVWHLYTLLCLALVGGLAVSWYGFSASPTTSAQRSRRHRRRVRNRRRHRRSNRRYRRNKRRRFKRKMRWETNRK